MHPERPARQVAAAREVAKDFLDPSVGAGDRTSAGDRPGDVAVKKGSQFLLLTAAVEDVLGGVQAVEYRNRSRAIHPVKLLRNGAALASLSARQTDLEPSGKSERWPKPTHGGLPRGLRRQSQVTPPAHGGPIQDGQGAGTRCAPHSHFFAIIDAHRDHGTRGPVNCELDGVLTRLNRQHDFLPTSDEGNLCPVEADLVSPQSVHPETLISLQTDNRTWHGSAVKQTDELKRGFVATRASAMGSVCQTSDLPARRAGSTVDLTHETSGDRAKDAYLMSELSASKGLTVGISRMAAQRGLGTLGAALIGFAIARGLSSALDVGLVILGALMVLPSLAWVVRDRERTGEMSPKTRVRAAQILVPIAVAIGVASAILGNWYTAAAMLFVILGQVVSYRRNRRRLDYHS